MCGSSGEREGDQQRRLHGRGLKPRSARGCWRGRRCVTVVVRRRISVRRSAVGRHGKTRCSLTTWTTRGPSMSIGSAHFAITSWSSIGASRTLRTLCAASGVNSAAHWSRRSRESAAARGILWHWFSEGADAREAAPREAPQDRDRTRLLSPPAGPSRLSGRGPHRRRCLVRSALLTAPPPPGPSPGSNGRTNLRLA